ncbi:MlaA family lipoprotein [Candidatus Methylospira mobilis]|uniref:MlaA family lipoprotein n=1 Tax=Candidatus Methylospira mobilis TaxID=1808979 RepID=UPI002240EDD3|nr:MlaA family lipoprotein [Candidatus Methylospira mobilis]
MVLLSFSACTTNLNPDPIDPWEEWSRGIQAVNDRMDENFLRPVAETYRWITPAFIDAGVANFMNNVEDILVVGNDLLQFKLAQLGMDSGRFMINTTFGLAGAVDIATYMGLAQTC